MDFSLRAGGRKRARLLEKVCIHDASSTDLSGGSACRSGESTLPACAVHSFSGGGGGSVGARQHADQHGCSSERFTLPCGRWDLVLAWPQVGLASRANTVPPYTRPPKMLPGCT